MENLAVVIGSSINWIILALAIITFGGFIYTYIRVGKIQNKIDADSKKSGGRKVYTGNGIMKEADVYSWEDILNNLETFNNVQIRYSIYEQFVPVFPLLGILGTVAGLIMQLGNIDQMREALALSMSTTFWGLIAAISLKIVDAIWISTAVNKMSLEFDSFEQNYQMVKDKFEQENENNRG